MSTIALVHFNHINSAQLTQWADMRTSPWKPNYGDMLVCASIIRQLKSEGHSLIRMNFGDTAAQPVRLALVRGSTYLHNQFNFALSNKTLDSIDGDIAVVGLGAQNPTQDVSFLDNNPEARAFISRLNERCVSISVRGMFTAAVVERLGAKNIRVTGCPSLFYDLAPPCVTVPGMLYRPERNLGVSIHTGLTDNIYCRAPNRARHMHAMAISYALRNAANVALFEQGVMEEFKIGDRSLDLLERLRCAEKVLRVINGEAFITSYELVSRMVSVKSIEEWLAKTRDLEAIIGFRFHGNMVALLQGAPCFYFVYDSRIQEFCDLYQLPFHDVEEEWIDPVEKMLSHDWNVTNTRIAKCYAELKSFYEENRVPSNLR